jgi:RNA polymerase sigma-70 factor (ECF subfamily)
VTAIADADCGVEEVLRQAQAGDHDAFAALIEEYQSVVFGIAWNFFPDRWLAEEIAQDVFLQLFKNLVSIQSPSHLLFWLRQVTSRKCIDAMRRSGPKRVALEDADLPVSPHLVDPLIARRIRACIAGLPDMQRLIVTLRYQEDLGPADIGRLIGVPENTVKSYLHRALEALRKEFGGTP